MTYALNDLGNAKRFAVRWLSELAYVEYPERITRQHNDSPWFAYSQELETWEMIHEPELFEYAAIVADELQAEAGDDEKLQRWATKTGEIPRIKRMLKLARFYMEATPEDVDLVVWKKRSLTRRDGRTRALDLQK